MPRAPVHPPTKPSQPLIVRLRNWVGDVVLGVPLLRLLQANGYQLHLVGKPWAQDMLRGEGWKVEPVAKSLLTRVEQLRHLRQQCLQGEPGFDHRVNAITLPFSFSSALEMRCAGLKALGVAHEGRSFFLHQTLPRPQGMHELQAYLQIARPLLPPQSQAPPAPSDIDLAVHQQHQHTARALCLAHRLESGFVMLCPFAGGTFEKKPKTWPGFTALSEALHRQGKTMLMCPGPGEETLAHTLCPQAVVLTDINLGVYAALLQRCALMISNDTGPGHLAASVGCRLLSVLGPTNIAQWRAWGSRVHLMQSEDQTWPETSAVIAQALQLLQNT